MFAINNKITSKNLSYKANKQDSYLGKSIKILNDGNKEFSKLGNNDIEEYNLSSNFVDSFDNAVSVVNNVFKDNLNNNDFFNTFNKLGISASISSLSVCYDDGKYKYIRALLDDGGEVLYKNSNDECLIISVKSVGNGYIKVDDNCSFALIESQKNDFLALVDNFDFNVDNFMNLEVSKRIKEQFNMSDADYKKYLEEFSRNKDKFNEVVKAVLSNDLELQQEFKETYGFNLIKYENGNLDVDIESFYQLIVADIYKDYYGATNLDDIIKVNSSRRIKGVPSSEELDGASEGYLPLDTLISVEWLDSNDAKPGYKGLCTWLVSNLCKLIYGEGLPNPSGDGSLVVGVFMKNSSMRDNFFQTSDISQAKAGTIVSYGDGVTEGHTLMIVDVNDDGTYTIAEGNARNWPGGDFLTGYKLCSETSSEGLSRGHIKKMTASELTGHYGFTMAVPKEDIGEVLINNINVEDVTKIVSVKKKI